MNAVKSTTIGTKRYIRLPEVCTTTGTSSTTIWRWVKNNPGFPQPIKLSAAVTAWDEAELVEWLECKKAERGQT